MIQANQVMRGCCPHLGWRAGVMEPREGREEGGVGEGQGTTWGNGKVRSVGQ